MMLALDAIVGCAIEQHDVGKHGFVVGYVGKDSAALAELRWDQAMQTTTAKCL